LKHIVEKVPPVLGFVATYAILEHGLEALKEWSDSGIRGAELLTQEVWSLALFNEENLER